MANRPKTAIVTAGGILRVDGARISAGSSSPETLASDIPRRAPYISTRIVLAILIFGLFAARNGFAESPEQICNIGADYVLGEEDYPAAIRLHNAVLKENPNNALAHYHLGFAEGMIGNSAKEVREYRRAEALGLTLWDLFLNLGLVQMGSGDFDAATDSLIKAVRYGREHFESHLALALAQEGLGQLQEAQNEALVALRLSPSQPEVRNELGVIYAKQGKIGLASQVWRSLAQERPDYQPVLENLAILDFKNGDEGISEPTESGPRSLCLMSKPHR
jgi:tetratricopeptide (TPR) repeat protein